MLSMRILLCMVGTAALAVLQTQAWAQPTDSSRYPDKAVRIIITSPPGGGQDRVARILQGPLQKLLGQPVVVESIAGAQGIIGTQNIIRSQPDGYRLMFMNTTQRPTTCRRTSHPSFPSGTSGPPSSSTRRFPARTCSRFCSTPRPTRTRCSTPPSARAPARTWPCPWLPERLARRCWPCPTRGAARVQPR